MPDNAMVHETPNFLVRLGLSTDADSRAIRRAYVRELKSLDQQTEAARFQDLREAYEVALRWIAHQEWLATQESGGEAAPVMDAAPAPADTPAVAEAPPTAQAPEHALDDPDSLALQAFEQFAIVRAQLTKGRALRDRNLWKLALQRQLDADALINVTARIIFEARIVHLLAGGWQLGHDTLFEAACAVFGWPSDRRRLQEFGYAGAALDRAIDESKMFEAQDGAQLAAQLTILRRLQNPAMPDDDQLRVNMPCLDLLQSRFPTLIGITVDTDRIAAWRKQAQLADEERGRPFEINEMRNPALAPPTRFTLPRGVMIALFFAFIAVLRNLPGFSGSPPAHEPFVHKPPTAAPAFGQPLPRLEPTDYAPLLTTMDKERAARPERVSMPTPSGLTREQLDEIASRIKYKRPASAAPARLHVEYDVQLTLSGAVAALKKTKASGDPAYDEAVADAIGKSKPFPPATARQLRLYYTAQYRPRPAKAAIAPEVHKPLVESPLADDGLPMPGKKLAWPPAQERSNPDPAARE